jgi:hypothetical protein
MRGVRILFAAAPAFIAVACLFACERHKELADSACQRLSACGQSATQGCCVDCAPAPKLTLTYACARRIVSAPTCDKALEAFNDVACIERTR